MELAISFLREKTGGNYHNNDLGTGWNPWCSKSSSSGSPPPLAAAALFSESVTSLFASHLQASSSVPTSDAFDTQYFCSHLSVSQRTCMMLSYAAYPWLSKGRTTRRHSAPWPFRALKKRSDCIKLNANKMQGWTNWQRRQDTDQRQTNPRLTRT